MRSFHNIQKNHPLPIYVQFTFMTVLPAGTVCTCIPLSRNAQNYIHHFIFLSIIGHQLILVISYRFSWTAGSFKRVCIWSDTTVQLKRMRDQAKFQSSSIETSCFESMNVLFHSSRSFASITAFDADTSFVFLTDDDDVNISYFWIYILQSVNIFINI